MSASVTKVRATFVLRSGTKTSEICCVTKCYRVLSSVTDAEVCCYTTVRGRENNCTLGRVVAGDVVWLATLAGFCCQLYLCRRASWLPALTSASGAWFFWRGSITIQGTTYDSVIVNLCHGLDCGSMLGKASSCLMFFVTFF